MKYHSYMLHWRCPECKAFYIQHEKSPSKFVRCNHCGTEVEVPIENWEEY